MALRRVKSGRKVTLKPSKLVSIKYGGKRQGKGFALSVRRISARKNKLGAKFALVVKKGKRLLRFWLCKRSKCVRSKTPKAKASHRLLKLRIKVSLKARSVSINGFVIKFKSLKALLKLLIVLKLKKAIASLRSHLKSAKKSVQKKKKSAQKKKKSAQKKSVKKSAQKKSVKKSAQKKSVKKSAQKKVKKALRKTVVHKKKGKQALRKKAHA